MENRRQPSDFGSPGSRFGGASRAAPGDAGFTASGHTPEPTHGLTIDMTPEGEIMPQRGAGMPWTVRVGVGAVIVAVTAALAVVAALFLWLASILIPVALVAGLIAYAAFRLQSWRLKFRGGPRSGWAAAVDVRRFRL